MRQNQMYLYIRYTYICTKCPSLYGMHMLTWYIYVCTCVPTFVSVVQCDNDTCTSKLLKASWQQTLSLHRPTVHMWNFLASGYFRFVFAQRWQFASSRSSVTKLIFCCVTCCEPFFFSIFVSARVSVLDPDGGRTVLSAAVHVFPAKLL